MMYNNIFYSACAMSCYCIIKRLNDIEALFPQLEVQNPGELQLSTRTDLVFHYLILNSC